ncbi:MAG: formyltransferase family protein [Pseudomonadota bacterium]
MKIGLVCSVEWPSLYLINELTRAGISLSAIYVREREITAPWNLKAFWKNRRRLGWRTAAAIFLDQSLGNSAGEDASNALGEIRSVRALRRSRLPVACVDRFTSDEFAERLHAAEHDLILICGTPVLPEKVVAAPRKAMLNIHTSVLPHYRGGGSLFWPIFFRNYDKIGYTIHRVTSDLDGGPTIAQEALNYEHGWSKDRLQFEIFRRAVPKLVDIIKTQNLDPIVDKAAPIDFVFRRPTPQFKRIYNGSVESPLKRRLRRIEFPIARHLSRKDQPSVTVIYAHRVLPDDTASDDWRRLLGHATVSETRRLMLFLKRHYDFISLDQLTELSSQNRWIERPSLVLTYDDGYEDFFTQGGELFDDLRIPAALFLSTSVLEGYVPYHQRAYDLIDRVRNPHLCVPWMRERLHFGDSRHRILSIEYVLLPYLKRLSIERRTQCLDELYSANQVEPDNGRDSYCSESQVRSSANAELLSVYLHGHVHEPYETLDQNNMRADLLASKQRFRCLLNEECPVMSYPNGSFTEAQLEEVKKAGFEWAFTTSPKKLIGPDFDRLRIPRMGFDNKDPLITARRLLRLDA